MSSAITRRSRNDSGTSLETILCASPSTIAVLPTPGSPISTGLFLVRRESTWITRRISSSRPITGSSLPCSAASVRSRPKRSSGLCCSSSAVAAPPAAGFTPSGVISPPLWRPAHEGRAYVGETHELAAAVGHRQLGAEGASQLLHLFGQAKLRLQCLHFELLDTHVHALELPLEIEHPLHAGEVESQLGRHLLDAAQLLYILLRAQPRALGRAARLDQPARLVHAKRLRVHVGQLCRHRDHEHAPAPPALPPRARCPLGRLAARG